MFDLKLDFCIRLIRCAFHRIQAYLLCGASCVRRIAAWQGPPIIGKPGHGQLFIEETLTLAGDKYSYLRRPAIPRPSAARIENDIFLNSAYILDATIMAAVDEHETLSQNVTHLMYHLPVKDLSPRELAVLLFGMRWWTRTRDCALIVTTLENAYRYDSDDVVDAPIFPDNRY